jgi:RimJ/RimL family protein N-acetyltransferase
MIVELESAHYARIIPLLDENYNNYTTVIRSVVNRNTRGRIFVDDPMNPKTALVWAINCLFYFVGNGQNGDFNESLLQLFRNTLTPLNLEQGCTTFIGAIVNDSGFSHALAEILKDEKFVTGYRQDYLFNEKLYKEERNLLNENGEEIKIKKIENQKNQMSEIEELSECILEFWPTMDEFMKKGIGFYLVKKNRIISSCFSCAVAGIDHEIVIETYQKEERNKGYGRLVTQAFIDDCLKSGLTPHWGTDDENIPSKRLALHLSFQPAQKFQYYEFRFTDIRK